MKLSSVCHLRGWDSCIAPVLNNLGSFQTILKNQSSTQVMLSHLVANLSQALTAQQSINLALQRNLTQSLHSIALLQKEVTELQTFKSKILSNTTSVFEMQSELIARMAVNKHSQVFTDIILSFLIFTVFVMLCYLASDQLSRMAYQDNIIDSMRTNLESIIQAWPTLHKISLCVNRLALDSLRAKQSEGFGLDCFLDNSGSYVDKRIALPKFNKSTPRAIRKKSFCEKVGSFFCFSNKNDNQPVNGRYYNTV